MAKKSSAKKRPSTKKKTAPRSAPRGDQSRLDLKPLQQHIRRRIKELEQGKPAAATRRAESPEDTIARLQSALETLEDICFPTMGIPI